MAATNYTPISLYYSTTAAAVPVNTNLVNGELAINITDGKLYYKNAGGTVTLLASTAGASGDVVGPASSTDNALARFDLATGKLIQNSVGILSDAGVLTGLTGLTSSGSITLSSLTSGRVTYAGASGLLQDSANLLFNGTTLTANTLNLTNALGTTYGGTGLTSFTANGVVYASSSSALATGSVLTFDGAQLGVNGITVGRGAGAVSTNTAVGSGAMAGTNTGGGNVGVGISALAVNTGGDNNTAIGNSALAANTNAQYNTAIGSAALLANTTGANNTAIGRDALQANTTASNNTAVGYQAGYSVTTSTENVFFGYQSGKSSTGQLNTIIGSLSGFTNTSGTENCYVGAGAGYLATGSQNTFVGRGVGIAAGSAMTTGSKNTILGGYNGNQGGLDIRTASNYIVLSDGDGNPWAAISGTEWLIGANTATTGDLLSNSGGNNSAYNGIIIAANKRSLAGQANTALNSWFVDIGGRAADGSTRPVSTSNKFSVGVQQAGNTFYGSRNVFEINENGCIAVGVDTATASTGAGITFPATQSGSSNANTLDDYEEGTWTPADSSGAGLTFTSVTALYTKIGREVTVKVVLTYPTTASTAGAAINNLPFIASTAGAGVFYSGTAAGVMYQSTTTLFFAQASGIAFLNSNLSEQVVNITATYFV